MPEHRFSLDEAAAKAMAASKSYLELLRIPALSVGVYRLPRGGRDEQTPHREAEIYYVRKGRARLELEGQSVGAEAGNVLYVPAGSKHRFVEIESDLELLVVFAPAEST